MTLTLDDVRQIRSGAKSLFRRATLFLFEGCLDLSDGATLAYPSQGQAAPPPNPQPLPGWDDKIPAEERQTWAAWLEELVDLEEIFFPRSIMPPGHRGVPSLVAFSDASL